MNFINIFSLRERAREFGVAICTTGHCRSALSLCGFERDWGPGELFSRFSPFPFFLSFFLPLSLFFKSLYTRARGIRDLIGAKCRKDILREYLKLSSRADMEEEREREERRGEKEEKRKEEAFPATRRFKLAFRENSEESLAKLFHNLWVFMTREREDENWTKLEQIYSYFGGKFFYPSNIHENHLLKILFFADNTDRCDTRDFV